jgi:predicted tellurium resistance membrane protein TerC
MAIILILLFLSLSGIIFMIGSKLILLKEGKAVTQENFPIQIPNPHELKHIVNKKSKKYGFIALVISIRLYVIASHFLKVQFKKFGAFLTKKMNKMLAGKHPEEPKEVSAFLQRMSDYKKKVKRIKDKIKEEEGID